MSIIYAGSPQGWALDAANKIKAEMVKAGFPADKIFTKGQWSPKLDGPSVSIFIK